MNCEKCQELLSDLLDGSLSRKDELNLNLHLEDCLDCVEVRTDLKAIVEFCREHRGEYEAPPNAQALWFRIRNLIEAEVSPARIRPDLTTREKGGWSGWLGRSWELSLPQLASLVAAIVVVVSLTTIVGVRRWESEGVNGSSPISDPVTALSAARSNITQRLLQQRQTIDYWNQRVELNKARWSPQMRETFDRNMRVIDQAVADSLNGLNQNPHDEVSEEMLNAAMNEKLSLLKEFADL
ncbi:MAG TPA: zf-HC2 domain-containing protein [Pyrinomonadaceae bacterium]|nr:zf-HC2 domain-containing protein [Pyrinomonadaceae bacterium]